MMTNKALCLANLKKGVEPPRLLGLRSSDHQDDAEEVHSQEEDQPRADVEDQQRAEPYLLPVCKLQTSKEQQHSTAQDLE